MQQKRGKCEEKAADKKEGYSIPKPANTQVRALKQGSSSGA
jgi:hypothetical protein